MQKSKRGRALFDKLSENGDEISDFLRRDHRWGRDKSAPSALSPDDDAGLRLVRERDRFDEGETCFCLDEGRLWFSVTPRIGAVLLFVATVMFLGSFLVGRSSGRAAGFQGGFAEGRASYEAEMVSEIEVARAMPPVKELVQDLRGG